MENKKYYIGLDIGTDSVGYAVTDEYYMPMKKCGEPLLGVTTFEAASQAAERRAFRTARRRLDRRQQRVALTSEIFAYEIAKKDPKFLQRRAESMLYREEAGEPYTVFNDPDFTDSEYYAKYPTIHHLIRELMNSNEKHDVRLVYLACAWLMANRGHFLFEVPAENVASLLDFSVVYDDFRAFFESNNYALPWDDIDNEIIKNILVMNTGVTRKKEAFKAEVYQGNKIPKETADDFPYNREAIITLLSGGKVKPADLFCNEEYADIDSISLGMADEDFARICGELGDDGELPFELRRLHDCAKLIIAQKGKDTISEAKVAVYEQHKADLAALKKFVKKYLPKKYNEIFRLAGKENYVAYSYNVKSCKDKTEMKGKAGKEVFSDYLRKLLKTVSPDAADQAFYDDMMARLETYTFLPKQKDTDNRVIPQQLYRYELTKILNNAEGYLPFLARKDDTGLTAKEKLLSIFDFRIPYFVGPLNAAGSHAWIERKAEGKIYPWNFKDLVDFDKSEEAFINNMTNTCTYLAGENVLPVHSLLYSRFTVLNEINNLKVNGNAIPVDAKQAIYNDVMMHELHPTLTKIKTYLVNKGLIKKTDEVTGVDVKLTSSLTPYQQFGRLLASGKLTEADVEAIIERAAYSEDKTRFTGWLRKNYPALPEEDIRYIAKLNLKEFGRLSEKLLTGIYGAKKDSGGEAYTIIEALWNTNDNLMQLLSDRYTYREQIEASNSEYYTEHPKTLQKRLNDIYISNAVKRPIYRTLDICKDITDSLGYAPEKIFIEMARDASNDKRGQRTMTRRQQLTELYKKVKTADARTLEKELEAMGEMADNRLQSDKLFLYYLQMGKCAYSGEPIDIAHLADKTYDIDHIYPRAFIKDDSVLNNKVLVLSKINGEKSDKYPLPDDIRSKMHATWECWKNAGLMTDEKYRRLIRPRPFTDDEKMAFINRQLVETRQSTKAVARILKDKYPEAQIVYVKAGLVSEFRKEYNMLKSRQVNNLHHAKDAYLNIVVGNVYDSRFSKQWFNVNQKYSLNTKAIFSNPVKCGGMTVWQGEPDLAKVRAVMAKNHIHMNLYAYCRKGKLFDQMPKKAAEGLVPLKKDLPTEKYGGYNKATASFFYLVKYTTGKKTEVMFMPVELMFAEKCLNDKAYATEYAARTIKAITGKHPVMAEILLNYRPIKINTLIEADGIRLNIVSKANGGKIIATALNTQLVLSPVYEQYIKLLESFAAKQKTNPGILPDDDHDHITTEKNIELYQELNRKMTSHPYSQCHGNIATTLDAGYKKFIRLEIKEQIECLINIISWFSQLTGGVNLTLIGGDKAGGSKHPASMLTSWKKKYKTMYIIDQSPAGIHEKRSCNLLDLL